MTRRLTYKEWCVIDSALACYIAGAWEEADEEHPEVVEIATGAQEKVWERLPGGHRA